MELTSIHDAPPLMFYISDFISEVEQTSILQSISSNRWITLKNRRLQAIPNRLSATNTLMDAPMPSWLTEPVVKRFQDLAIFKDAPHGPNHCLINEYLPGQGIMPHEDGDAYYPVVATVSLGASIVLDVQEKRNHDDAESPRKAWRIFQEPRSLLVTTGSAYTDTLHGIADVAEDSSLNSESVANWDLLRETTRKDIQSSNGCLQRQTRISLTYRDVRKVSKLGSKLFGRPRG